MRKSSGFFGKKCANLEIFAQKCANLEKSGNQPFLVDVILLSDM
jgi:hypothetical protein